MSVQYFIGLCIPNVNEGALQNNAIKGLFPVRAARYVFTLDNPDQAGECLECALSSTNSGESFTKITSAGFLPIRSSGSYGAASFGHLMRQGDWWACVVYSKDVPSTYNRDFGRKYITENYYKKENSFLPITVFGTATESLKAMEALERLEYKDAVNQARYLFTFLQLSRLM